MTPGFPFGKLVSRYLVSQNLSILVQATSLGVSVFLLVDFLERVAMFIQYGAGPRLALKYVFFRIPWYVSNVLPVAYLLSVLLALGRLTRQNEVLAMRAGGISLREIARVTLLVAAGTSVFSSLWNEWVVPAAASRAEKTRKIEIQKKDPKGVLSNQGIWIRGTDAFYQIRFFDRRTSTLRGIRIFRVDRDFHLIGVVEAESAVWSGKEWVMSGSREQVFFPPDWEAKTQVPTSYHMTESIEEFNMVAKEPEEFGIFELRDYIQSLRARGIDPKSYEVDLEMKISANFLPLVMGIIGIPFALRHPRMGSVAASFSLSLAIGFSFWVVQAVGISLARGGAMLPVVAAWLPHVIFFLIGLYSFLTVEER